MRSVDCRSKTTLDDRAYRLEDTSPKYDSKVLKNVSNGTSYDSYSKTSFHSSIQRNVAPRVFEELQTFLLHQWYLQRHSHLSVTFLLKRILEWSIHLTK